MKKKNVIIGLSLTGLLVLSGTALALASGGSPWEPTSPTKQANVIAVTAAEQSPSDAQSPSALATINTQLPNSENTNPAYGYGYGIMGGNGSYGMMGGNGSYGMMGGNGSYGMMGGNGSYGMMGGNGSYGMMGGNGSYGMMGGNGSYGMMGGGYSAASLGVTLQNGQVSNSEEAISIAKAYIQKLNSGLVVYKIYEYSQFYSAKLKDANSAEIAYDFIISKNGGFVYPQMGPKMMFNSNYGHMNWGNQINKTITSDQASQIAQDYVSKMSQGLSVGKLEAATGYYEFMVTKDNKDYAELIVNGYTGQVWVDNGYGPILSTVEVSN